MPDEVCVCGHKKSFHIYVMGYPLACFLCRCRGFRPSAGLESEQPVR